MVKTRKSIVPILTAVFIGVICALLSLSALSYGVRADARPVSPADGVYFYIGDASSVCGDDSNFYVTTFSDSVYKFTPAGKSEDIQTLPVAAEKSAVLKSCLFLLSEGILSLSDGTQIASGVLDVSVAADELYALTESGITVYAPTESGGADEDRVIPLSGISAKLIAANPEGIFLIADSSASPYLSDIYMLSESGSPELLYPRAPYISHAVSPSASVLVVSQPSELSRYEIKYGIMKKSHSAPESDVRSLSSNGSVVYALTGEGTVLAYSHALSNRKEVIASASSQNGFFRNPSDIFTRRGALYVADRSNNRISILSEGGITQLEYGFKQPTAVAVDYLANIFVAHDTNVIDVFDADKKHTATHEVSGAVADMKFDGFGNLYVLTADGKLYVSESGAGGFTALQGVSAVVAIAVSPSEADVIYALEEQSGSKSVRRISPSIGDESAKNERLFSYSDEVVSFTADIAGDFYFLTATGDVIKYRPAADDTAEELARASGSFGAGASRIIISTVENGSLGYGDIIVSDPIRHCVTSIARDELSVAVAGDDDTELPDSSPNPEDGRIVYVAERDIDVFPHARDMNSDFVIEAGRKFILANGNLKTSQYVLIFIDDVDSTAGGGGIYRYMYRAQLPSPESYAKKTLTTVTTYSKTSVYKYPSRNAPKLEINGKTQIEKGEYLTFEVLDFVEGYTDDYRKPFKWIRVKVDGGEGYVISDHVGFGKFRPAESQPRMNATVLAPGALAYLRGEDGKLVLDERGNPVPISANEQPDIAAGKRVEVLDDPFDESKEFTRILYLDADSGQVLECYVRTECLKYDGVGLAAVIAVILIVLAVIGIIVITVWHAVAKKRKITKA